MAHLCCTTLTIDKLMDAVYGSTRLPPRILAVLCATQLRPEVLLGWVESAAMAAGALLPAVGVGHVPNRFLRLLHNLFSLDICPGVHDLARQRPGLQLLVVELAAREMRLAAAAGEACLQRDASTSYLTLVRWACELALAPCLADGRLQHETASPGSSGSSSGDPAGASTSSSSSSRSSHIDHSGSSAGSSSIAGSGAGSQAGSSAPGLLCTAAAIAVSLAPSAVAGHSRHVSAQAGLLLAVLRLGAHSVQDVLMAQQRGAPELPQMKARLVQTLGAMLPVLCQLAAEVAAAAPGGAGANSLPLAAAAAAAALPAADCSYGGLCWGSLATGWQQVIQSWDQAAYGLASPELLPILASSSYRAVAAAAAQALMRLMPLLLLQPALSPAGSGASGSSASGSDGGLITVAADVAAAGGLAAVAQGLGQPEGPAAGEWGARFATPLLADRIPVVVQHLLVFPREAPVTAELAAPAFQAISTACRYTHAVAAELGRGNLHPYSSGSSSGSGAPAAAATIGTTAESLSSVANMLNVAFASCWQCTRTAPGTGRPSAQDDTEQRRCLERMLLLYLAAVQALPPTPHPEAEGAAVQACNCSRLLNTLLSEVQLADLWKLLLPPPPLPLLPRSSASAGCPASGQGSGVGVGSSSSAAVLPGGAAAVLACAVCHMVQAILAQPPADFHNYSVYDVVAVVWRAADLSRGAAVAAMQRHGGLLRALCQLARRLLGACTAGEASAEHLAEARQAYELVRTVLCRLTGGLLWGDDAAGAVVMAAAAAELQTTLEASPSYDAGEGSRGLDVLWSLVAELPFDDTPASGGTLQQAVLLGAKEQQQLAVRCARALGMRNCANPRCANLAGASEAAVKGRKCGGCGAVRFCGEACSKADWRQHRVACRLLNQAGTV